MKDLESREEQMKQPKYTIDDVVYIAFWNNVIECIVKEILEMVH